MPSVGLGPIEWMALNAAVNSTANLEEKDGVWKGIKDLKQREAVTVEFAPLKGSRIGEVTARFDIVLGLTPEV